MKIIYLLLIGLFTTYVSLSQDIKLSKGKVLCDGKEILSFTKEIFGEYQYHFFTLDSKEEILFIKKNDNQTKTFDDDFTQIKFLQLGKMVETRLDKPWKKYIEWLMQNKVLDNNGKLDEEKVNLFIKNYNENITNRTINIKGN